MTRVAIVRGSDDVVRRSDPPDVAELGRAIVAAGHELVEPAACEVAVVMLSARGGGAPALPGHARCVAVIGGAGDPPRTTDDDHAEAARASLETVADAYVLGPRWLAAAIAWVATEDRAQRTVGPPRLTVIGSCRDDLGMSRRLVAEPLVIGRSSSFREHPMRPDRMPTPAGSIARAHARVRAVGGRIEICDLGSTNGTLVIPRGGPARLLCPMQAETGRQFGPPASAWLVRIPSRDWSEVAIGDQLQLPGFWRFRFDGELALA